MSKKLITKYIIIAHRTIMIATILYYFILFYHTRRNLGSVDEINLKKKKEKKN